MRTAINMLMDAESREQFYYYDTMDLLIDELIEKDDEDSVFESAKRWFCPCFTKANKFEIRVLLNCHVTRNYNSEV